MRFLAAFAVMVCLAAFASLVWVAGAGATTDFHGQVTALYSFSPHKLTEKEIEAKSKQLNVFWSETKARGEAGLKDLRLELGRPDASPFFSYDGAKLLLSLSNEREDRELAQGLILDTHSLRMDRSPFDGCPNWSSTYPD